MDYMRRDSNRAGVAFGILMALLLIAPLFGDGKVTQPAIADPIATWRIVDLRFPLEQAHSSIITVGYFRQSGARDHVEEVSTSGDEYDSLLFAINQSSGTDEATLTKPDGSPDLAAIFRLRISRWMVFHSKISGVTADPTPTSTQ